MPFATVLFRRKQWESTPWCRCRWRFGASRGEKSLHPEHGATSVTDCCFRGTTASSAQKECGDGDEGVIPAGNDERFVADIAVDPEGVKGHLVKGDNTLYAAGSMMSLWSLIRLVCCDQVIVSKYSEIS